MTVMELMEELEKIHRERILSAHHDGMFLKTYDDVEAMNKIILMVKFLAEKNPEYRLTVSEILNAAQIEH